MKTAKGQQGYALLIVLLMITLFMSISATFIAGSLNHSKQEQTVDTSNHAVAAAEMGTVYFNSDFEKELNVIKQEISDETHLALNKLIVCIQYPMESGCDTELKRIAWEEQIDKQVRESYITKIMNKAQRLNSASAEVTTPFVLEDIKYKIHSATATKLNAAKQDIDGPTPDKEITSINVKLDIQGFSEGVEKNLAAYLDINVPRTFLNPDEPRNVQTNIITVDEDLTYEDIFKPTPPTKSCTQLLEEVKAKTPLTTYECYSQDGETLDAFVKVIEDNQLDPKDFRVFTSDFNAYVCETNCNSLDFKGISVVVPKDDVESANNMNNLVNANLIFNGKLTVGNNLINLGKNGTKQTIVVKELVVGVNLKNLYYTNFLILGYEDPNILANLDWKNQIGIANYSNLCLDIDRIHQNDLDRLSREIDIVDSSKILYYTKDAEKFFKLTDANGADRMVTIKNEETGKNEQRTMTELYVQRESSYSNFLKNCGVTLKNSKTTSIDVSVPVPLDTDFDVEVKY